MGLMMFERLLRDRQMKRPEQQGRFICGGLEIRPTDCGGMKIRDAVARVALVVAVLSMGIVGAGEAWKPKAAEPAKPKKKPGDKKAVEMDYGPYMAITVGVTKENIAYKGILIPLNKEKTLNVLFDTELMRVTAVWSGGFLNWASRNYADNNNDYCTVDGKVEFATPRLPGWSHDGKRDDPRNPRDGPLPKEWAKYTGLYLHYLHHDQVAISYTVDGVPVFETYAADLVDGNGFVFARRLQIGPSDKAMELLAFEAEPESRESKASEINASTVTVYSREDAMTQCSFNRLPKGSGWKIDDSQVASASRSRRAYLTIAPHSETLTVDLHYVRDKRTLTKWTTTPRIAGLLAPGAARWTKEVTTKGVLAKDDAPYVIDNLTVPEDNPYKSWMRLTGLDFFADGRATVCTWNGDVWIVSGIDAKLENLKWKRFATGLNNPMGVKIVDGVIHTIGRDQITKLHDLNNDGEADFYENINNDCYLTTNFHEMCFDLQTDKEGNFYFTKGSSIWAGEQRMTPHNGTVIKVSKDGSKFETLCSGLRAPNGIGIGPNDELTVADNQGNWIPSCPVILVKKDGYYGWVGQNQKAEQFKTPDPPLCWIPYNQDKSSSGQVWVPKDNTKWGPFANRMLLTSYDCSLTEVFFDTIDGTPQGGSFRFPLKFASGMMRPRFNPVDGQLYIAGLKGWSSSAAREGALQRVRYTGKPVLAPVEVHLNKSGFEIAFAEKLDAASVADKQNVSAEWFNVVRSAAYGSPEFSISDPKKKGRETIEIADSKLKDDGKTVGLTIPNLKPVTNVVIKYKFKAADGAEVKGEVDYTINRMP